MAATRVYILAKELGVKSSAIVKKCQDEGLDIKNHMSVISAGLAATIREWFSEGDNVTTVETSDKVDLEKVRVKRKKKAKKKPAAEEIESEEAVEEKPASKRTMKAAKTEKAESEQQAIEDIEELPGTAVITEQPSIPEQEVTEAPETEPEPELPPEPEPEPEPEPIVPAGPILEKPKPAKLSGPRVVRVEAPEPIRRPRPKPRSRYDAPVTEPLMYSQREQGGDFGPAPTKDKRQPKRHKERTYGRRKDDSDIEVVRKARLDSKWRQIDIEERRARLDAAGGEGLRSRPMRKIATKLKQKISPVVRPKKVNVNEPITVKDLSAALAVKSTDIILKLMQQGVMATANQVISNDVAELVALEFETELVVEHKSSLAGEVAVARP